VKTAPRSRHAISWLRAEPGFAALGEQAQRLAALQQDVQQALPGWALTVIALERETLVLGAAHAAMAARLRQVGPSLMQTLRARGWTVGKVRFKPQWRPDPPLPQRAPKQAPGAAAVARITALSTAVSDPRLRAALERLAARHSNRPPRTSDTGGSESSR
jgi:hypothetical protein